MGAARNRKKFGACAAERIIRCARVVHGYALQAMRVIVLDEFPMISAELTGKLEEVVASAWHSRTHTREGLVASATWLCERGED